MNTNDLHRKARILWLSTRIRYHRIIMDAEQGATRHWKYHARLMSNLCRVRSELYTAAERREIERREGLV